LLNKFELLMPETLDEALDLYEQYGNRCKILAGGTDVLVEMHTGHKEYPLLMDIKNLDELKGIRYCPETGLEFGALTTHRELEINPIAKELYTALQEAVSQVGCVQTRYRGTVGGNICTAAPSGDTIGPLMVLGAVAVTKSRKYGEREIPLTEFFTGPKRTVLKEGELLIKIKLPARKKNSASAYTKYTRRNAMDLALLGAAVDLTCANARTCKSVRITLTTAAPTVIRATQTEEFLTGKELTEEVIREAGIIASAEAKPRSSWRSSEQFRREVLKAIVPRTITNALSRISERAVLK